MNFCETCGQVLPGPVYELGRLRIDTTTDTATLDGAPFHLTHIEFTILAILGRRPGMPFSYDILIDALELDFLADPTKNLQVHISGLRRKLEGTGVSIPDQRSDPGLGIYRLVIENAHSSSASRI